MSKTGHHPTMGWRIGACEFCGRPIYDKTPHHWDEDGIMTHVRCPGTSRGKTSDEQDKEANQ